MMRAYQMRLKVRRRQDAALGTLLGHLCDLYNAALQERREAWKLAGKSIGYYTQQKELAELRQEQPDYAAFPAAIQRDPLRRVQRAFDGFFRRCKAGQKPGYPRFRPKARYDSFSVDSQNFRIEGDTIIVRKLGGFRFKTRAKLRGIPKILDIKRCGKQWNASVVCDTGPAPEKVGVRKVVGMDVGLTHLATLSDGTQIENPRWTGNFELKLAEAHRRLSSKQKGSKNRAKARERLRRLYQRIVGRRRSYLHGVSSWLLKTHDLIAYEKLNIREMAESRLAKSILDAAWGELIWQLTYKAESAGKWVVPVNPRGTTQTCSGCGEVVPKALWQRTHNCPHCQLVLGRDHNAALNILRLGKSLAEVRQKV